MEYLFTPLALKQYINTVISTEFVATEDLPKFHITMQRSAM